MDCWMGQIDKASGMQSSNTDGSPRQHALYKSSTLCPFLYHNPYQSLVLVPLGYLVGTELLKQLT